MIKSLIKSAGWTMHDARDHGAQGMCHLITRDNLPSRQEALLTEDLTRLYPSVFDEDIGTFFDLTTEEGRQKANDEFLVPQEILTGPDLALAYIERYGGIDGSHHKQWVLDQVVRALHFSPRVTRDATDSQGTPYTYLEQGESDSYIEWVKAYQGEYDEEYEEYEYTWDNGGTP